jgi:hypothetical protein
LTASYTFRLPGYGVGLAPVLRTSGAIARRQYVLLFDLPDDPELELGDPTLTWSDSLESMYRYAPVTSSGGTVPTPAFEVPGGARSIRVRVRQRGERTTFAVEDVALATEVMGTTAVIFAEEHP